MRLLNWVAQRTIRIDFIVVTASDPGSLHIALLHEVGDDRLGGALGDPDPGGNVPAANAVVKRDADEDVAMVGEEGPGRPRRLLRVVGARHGIDGTWFREPSDGGCARGHRRTRLRET